LIELDDLTGMALQIKALHLTEDQPWMD